METRQDETAHQKVFDLIKDIRVAQMVTVTAGGRLRSQPMVSRQETFSGELWFFTSAAAGKIGEIEQSGEVLLTYSDPARQNYVSFEGEGELIRETAKAEEVWSETMRVWFPKGPIDPDVALVRVRVREATYWDSPSSAFVVAYGHADAMATGGHIHPGDTRSVEFSRGSPP